MGYTWQTVEEAAIALKCSTRTINRRVKDGTIESRLNGGRREVLVCIPDEPQGTPTLSPPAAEPAVAETTEAVRHAAGVVARAMPDDRVALAEEQARRSEIALSAFRQSMSVYREEAARARRNNRLAWAAVVLLALVLYVAVGWTAGMVSRARAQRDHLAQQAKALADLAQQRQEEAEAARREAAAAIEARARLEGELAGLRRSSLVQAPTTRPGFLARLLSSAVGPE